MGKKSEENYSKPLKTAFYNLKKGWELNVKIECVR